MQRTIMNQGSTIRVPIHLQQAQRRVSRVAEHLALLFGSTPSVEDIGNRAHLSSRKVRLILSFVYHPHAWEWPLGPSGKGPPIRNTLADSKEPSPA